MSGIKKLVLIGGGGHCKSVLDAALRKKEFEKYFVSDDRLKKDSLVLGEAFVVGNDDFTISLIKEWMYAGDSVKCHISIGGIKNLAYRERVADKFDRTGVGYSNIVDSSAIIGKNAMMYEGCFIGKHSVINAEASIGIHTIINTGVIIEHESIVDNFSHISVGTRVCGGCYIGKRVFVGAGTTIIQNVKIGDDAIIGAGSIVLRDVRQGEAVYGIVK